MSALWLVFRRELALAWAGGGGPLLALGFYLAVAAMIPLGAALPLSDSPASRPLAAVAPALAWVGLALASLLSLERLFERDFEDGALDLLALGPAPLEGVAAAKCLAQWVANGAPLSLAAPLCAIALGAPVALAPLILACAAVGGIAFSFMGGIGAALALGSRRGGLLIALIVLPLLSPPVIFGGGAIDAFAGALPWQGEFLKLAAYALGAAALAPFAMAAAWRNASS